MMRSAFSIAFACAFTSLAMAHCQVPCGIYGDQLRFEQMLEDEHTIAKAQAQINEMTAGEITAQKVNQMAELNYPGHVCKRRTITKVGF